MNEEEFMEEVIGRYVEKNTTHIKGYTKEYVDNLLQEKDKEIERLKKIAKKMHLWIFLHSEDEQKVYDELGLTDEENAILGYSGQIRIGGDDNE